ncbi:MAG: hypothetical protein KatS3mg110_0096 [Pirellulaceae bacterium]|nr:MAG: hypothetical protein KatS3mg110_0096 [Pirellulaceae bacterium]
MDKKLPAHRPSSELPALPPETLDALASSSVLSGTQGEPSPAGRMPCDASGQSFAGATERYVSAPTAPGTMGLTREGEAAEMAGAARADAGHPSVAAQHGGAVESTRLRWLLMVFVFLLGVRYFVPWFAEEVQYAISRGKLRAEYEWAGRQLSHMPPSPLSLAGKEVARRIAPSVVHISVKLPAESTDAEPTLFNFPFHRQRQRWAGQGSGIIVDTAGYVLTNYHVVKAASEISVRLSDGRRVPARLVNHDEMTDLAVLKIDAEGLIPVEWGDSENVEVGSQVWAVGSPFGLQQSLTTGILSAKHRGGVAGSPHQDFLQSDAPVNPGNSGGPLVDEQGKVIGINTAIVGEAFQGVSFAIPSHVARNVFERLVRDGKVRRGWLGVQMDEVSEELASQLELGRPYGALIIAVVDDPAGCPAREAGIQVGDVVVSWNDQPVDNPAALSRLVAQTAVGSKARVRLRRGTEWVDLAVLVGEHPSSRSQ